MATERAIFTALPNGVLESGEALRLSVFVSPRLSTDGAGKLALSSADFPAFADWPQTLQDVRLSILFDGAAQIPAEPDPSSLAADLATWHLLFKACSVRDGTFTDRSTQRILSFPVATVSAAIFDLYSEIAEVHPTAFPPVTSGRLAALGDDLGQIGRYKNEFYPQLDNLIANELGPNGKSGRYLDRRTIPVTQRERLAFTEAYRFYDRPGARDPLGPATTPPPPDVPDIDFHGFVAACGDYPLLLRRLGLAMDVLVAWEPAIQPSGRIRVIVEDAPAAFMPWMTEEQARPWTRYEIADRRFLPHPRTLEHDLVDGMLRLEWEQERLFLVTQFDVDGTALKVVDLAGNLQRIAEHVGQNPRSMTPDASSLPALRTGGFTIARDARAELVVANLDTAADHETSHGSGTAPELAAEDVTRGYRLDVEDSKRPGVWRSLHERIGSYVVKGPGGQEEPIELEADEGFLKGASTTSVPGDDDLYLHEALFGWEGWSLAAKRPGQAITNTGAEPIEPENPTDFPLYTSFEAAPGSLPRLRFGRTYRFRARAVDLAGNSVREDDIVPDHVTNPHTFRRFEPVPSPAVVPRRPFTEGESLMRMVIRSTLGVLPHEYVALPRITSLAGHTDPLLAYLEANDRHLAPPIGSQQLAEWHGRFDAAVGESATDGALDAEFDIAALESGSYLASLPGAFVYNPDPSAAPTDLTDPSRAKGDPLQPREYVCHDTDDLSLPYLPDPLSLGASLTVLPGESTTRLQKWEAAGASWHQRHPFLIRIEHGAGAPVYNGAKRLLTVFLPQAEMVTVQLSSFMDPSDLPLMAIWMLEREFVRAAQQPWAELGLHWMLTPSQPLTLVHAVEKPLTPPVVNVPHSGIQRNVGETFAVLSGTIANHAKSTGRLDVEARWTEPIDDLAQDAPSTIDGRGHVGDFQITASEDACKVGRDDSPASGTTPPVHKLRHEFRDTKHRYVTYRAIATTRFREYFPAEITDDPSLITHEGAEVERNVRSSRRPEPPEILYVIPTWTWTDQTVRGLGSSGPVPTTLRTRSGGGLRVYIDRPWYSSGVDELLGVVLENQPWITWPIDVEAGLTYSSVAKALADDLAAQAFAEGIVKPGGPISESDSERLIRGVLKARAPKRRAPSTPPGAAATAAQRRALRSHTVAEMSDVDEVNGATAANVAAPLTEAQIDQLNAVLRPFFPPTGDPQRFVTHWGLDPIWGSAPVNSGPYVHQFPLRVAVGTGISLVEAPGHSVTVVGHQPEFDEVRKLWYCDLQLEAGSSYFPFVRLALARYQPHSIAGQHLSSIVFPDFAQLVSRRTAAMTRLGRSAVAISLRGPGGYTDNAEDLVPFFAGVDDTLNLSRFAVAQVERLPAGATTDLAWTAVGDEVRLELSATNGLTDIRYFGTVPLPARGAGEQLRLSLREYEIFETDESEADDHVVRPIGFGALGTLAVLNRPVKYRLVYAAELPL